MRLRILFVSLFLVGLVGGVFAWVSSRIEEGENYGPHGWGSDRIQAECDRLQVLLAPRVERHAGRSFRRPVTIRVTANRQALDLLIQDLQQRHEQGHIPAERVEEIRQLDGDSLGMFLGLYRPLAREILVLPENMEASMDLLGLDEDDIPALLAYMVAHELTHALQDDYVSLLAYEAAGPCQADRSLIATFEGHATWVGWRAAGDVVDIGHVRERIEAQPLPELFLAEYVPQLFGYRYGHRWMDAVYRRHGVEGQWAYLAEPPEQFWPFVGAYGFRPAAAEKLDRRVRRALQVGPDRQVTETVRTGGIDDRAFARNMVQQVPTSLEQMEGIVCFDIGADQGAVLSFAAESAAADFFASARVVLEQNDDEDWQKIQKPQRLRIGHIAGPGPGRSLLLEKTGRHSKQVRILLRAGRHVIVYERTLWPVLPISRLYSSDLEQWINVLWAEFGGKGWVKNIRWQETRGELPEPEPPMRDAIEIPLD
jgi:hypothetical protein